MERKALKNDLGSILITDSNLALQKPSQPPIRMKRNNSIKYPKKSMNYNIIMTSSEMHYLYIYMFQDDSPWTKDHLFAVITNKLDEDVSLI